MNGEDFRIDLERIIAAKARGKKIPAFAVKLLKKLVHEDFLNKYFEQGKEGVDFCNGAVEYLGIKLDITGLENLDKSGRTRYTFVSNHPLGGIDGVALGGIVGKIYDGNIKYLVNDLLMNLKGLAPLCVPINVTGAQNRNLPALIDEAFHSDKQMILFPGKLCSRRIEGKVQDLPWGKAFINKSVDSGRHIVPVHFIGENSRSFYNIANLCKRIGLKFNLAMLLLPHELFKARNSHFKVVFGKPVAPESFDSSRTPYEWAQYVRQTVYTLN